MQTVLLFEQFKVYKTQGEGELRSSTRSSELLLLDEDATSSSLGRSIYSITNTCDNEKLIKDIVRKKNSLIFQQTTLLTEITISQTTFLCMSKYRCASKFSILHSLGKENTKKCF